MFDIIATYYKITHKHKHTMQQNIYTNEKETTTKKKKQHFTQTASVAIFNVGYVEHYNQL